MREPHTDGVVRIIMVCLLLGGCCSFQQGDKALELAVGPLRVHGCDGEVSAMPQPQTQLKNQGQTCLTYRF